MYIQIKNITGFENFKKYCIRIYIITLHVYIYDNYQKIALRQTVLFTNDLEGHTVNSAIFVVKISAYIAFSIKNRNVFFLKKAKREITTCNHKIMTPIHNTESD